MRAELATVGECAGGCVARAGHGGAQALRHDHAEGQREDERREAEYLNDLLSRWHAWAAGHTYGAGYPHVNAASRLYRCSRQYDDQNGALDAAVDKGLLEAVDAIINQIAQPYRLALSVQARNLQVRAKVWSSPRLPVDPLERARLTVQARKYFRDGLEKADLL